MNQFIIIVFAIEYRLFQNYIPSIIPKLITPLKRFKRRNFYNLHPTYTQFLSHWTPRNLQSHRYTYIERRGGGDGDHGRDVTTFTPHSAPLHGPPPYSATSHRISVNLSLIHI